MPEIKNTFVGGKINQDLDERIVPNGEYIDAMNIKVNSSDDSSVGTVQNILGNSRVDMIVPQDYLCIATIADEKTNKLYWFVTKQLPTPINAILQYDLQDPNAAAKIVLIDKNNSTLKFTTKIITGINIVDNFLFWTDGVNEPKKINIDDCLEGTKLSNPSVQDLNSAVHTKLVVNGVPKGDIEEKHITVIKTAPRTAPSTTILPDYDKPAVLFEKVFPRFSYRYKYKDGEYSSFGPFTEVIFNPIYKEEYNLDNAYSLEEGNNAGMVNNIKAIRFQNFKHARMGKNVVQVELLYKEEGSSVVFSVKKINYNDPEWSQNQFLLESQDIFAAIPENQLLRAWDNVPKKALAQEVTGNRIVYGNYTQGANLITSDGDKAVSNVVVDYEKRDLRYTFNSDFDLGGINSLKSQREYNVGIIWGDKYGRETPVNENVGSVTVPWYDKNTGLLLASNSNSLKLNVNGDKPYWADYYKFFVKENSGEYYNLLMDKAYIAEKVNLFDEAEEKIWLGFVSSDRNKISDQEYIILKKQVGTNELQIPLENKFKVIDVQNEAPDAIKYRYVDIGRVTDSTNNIVDNLDLIFPETSNRPNAEIDMLYIGISDWVNTVGGSLQQGADNAEMWIENLYTSWKDTVTGKTSERYRIISSINNGNDQYMLKLDRKINTSDAAIALKQGSTTNEMNDDLEFLIQKREEVELEEFTGKFFVQISSLSSTQSDVTDEELNNNHMQVANQSFFWFYDDVQVGTNPIFAGGPTEPSPTPSLASNVSGVTGPITDTETDYSSLMAKFGNINKGFFVDNLYMASSQVHGANYAKSTGRAWFGRHDQHAVTPTWGRLLQDGDVPTVTTTNTEVYGWGYGFFNGSLGNPGSTPNPSSPHFGKKYPLVDLFQGGFGINENWVQGQKLIASPDQAKTVNSMEGFVETTDAYSSTLGALTAYRRWRKPGFTNLFGNYFDGDAEETYGTENGVHYMQISFLAPGKDLHSGFNANFDESAPNFGNDSPGNFLQAIWGGGIFNDTVNNNVVEMEGNYNVNDDPLVDAPGPNVGYGYDDTFDYRAKHENQWEPTYGLNSEQASEIESFIQNLAKDKKFKFSSNDDEIFTILANPIVKKVYNHTAWNRDYDRRNGTSYEEVESVEKAALTWANSKNTTNFDAFKEKIIDFGKASNRRLVYIFPINKNPLPLLNANGGAPEPDFDAEASLDINFITANASEVLSQVVKGSAIWETEPKKDDKLEIYYEASQAYPTKLTTDTNVDFAPHGGFVEFISIPEAKNGKHIVESKVQLVKWTGKNRFAIATGKSAPGNGVNKFDDNGDTIDYKGGLVRFYRKEGGYTTARISANPISAANETFTETDPVTGQVYTYTATSDYYNQFYVEENIDISLDTGLNWYNCFTFGNGIESNRIRDDFNNPTISNGVKASIVLETDYKEEHRKSGLIFSGIYNSNSGVNNLNQFIMAENITKDLNPTYGGIQKLFQRRISLVAFCEDRVISITSNKDALFNADGNSQLVATNAVLGDATPFVGDFGISKNPESFAKDSYRAYFADKQRGAVLRLSMDGITPISEAGMDDYFRDNLKLSGEVIGSFDAYDKNYNITFSGLKPTQSLILNSFIDDGSESTVLFTPSSIIIDPYINSLTPITLPTPLNINNGNSELSNRYLDFKTHITNYDEQAVGSIEAETQTITTTQDTFTTFGTAASSFASFNFTNAGNHSNTVFGAAGSGYGGADKKWQIKRNYASQFVTDSEASLGGNFTNGIPNPLEDHYPSWTYGGTLFSNGGTSTITSASGFWYGSNPDIHYAGPSGDIIWNRDKDLYDDFYSYAIDTSDPTYFSAPFQGGGETSRPWFFNASGAWQGLTWDGTLDTVSAIFPGVKATANDISTPAPVLAKYTSAAPNTIFNGEEVRIQFYARNHYKVNSDGTGGMLGQYDSTADYTRYINIQLYDGIPGQGGVALSDEVIFDGNNVPPGVSGDFGSEQSDPNPQGTYLVGFQPTASFSFPTLVNDNNIQHNIFFKFTNDTATGNNDADNTEQIVVQNLQAVITWKNNNGSTAQRLFGTISSLNMIKKHQLIDVDTFTTTTTNNGDAQPPVTIPAFVEVDHDHYPYWVLQDAAGNVLDEDPFAEVALGYYGPNHIAVQQTATNNDGVTNTWYVPPNGDVSNGTTFYDDGSGGGGMYTTGTKTTNDKFAWNGGSGDNYLIQSNTVVTGNWYAIALMRVGTPSGDVPVLEHYNIDFELTDIPFDFIEGNTLHPAYFCIFEGDDTITEIKIKLPASADFTMSTINMIDISETWTPAITNQMDHWITNIGSSQNPFPQNFYDKPKVYGDTAGIVFDSPEPGNYISVRQDHGSNFAASANGWLLEFHVSNYNSGTLNFHITDANGDGISGLNVIDRNGFYRVYFNDFTTTYDVLIDEGLPAPNSGFQPHGTTSSISGSSLTNLIWFSDNGGIECVVNSIKLTDQTQVFSGGSADNFTFSGFDELVNDYIIFDAANQNIEFINAPITDLGQVQVQQAITQPTYAGQSFRVLFEHSITQGAINGYYFNDDGEGFRFGTISAPTFQQTYNTLHTIGEATWVAGELKNTFVIFVDQDQTSGTIDNITFRQEFSFLDENGNDMSSTISFSEKVRGWVSRKSFVPEQGVSLSSDYFTFKNGGIFKHNEEIIDINSGDDTNRNTFYGVSTNSTITTVLNTEPSTIKSFNTIKYEGSQSKVQAGDPAVLITNPDLSVSSYSTLEAYNQHEKAGWSVEYIKTDKQEGSVNEFIEKEGKWFNYIRGNEEIKTSDLSFQGLGIVKGTQ